MPVHAVIFAGRSRVSSGSAMTTFGSISGWKMIFLVWSDGSVTTAARPTSEPVPAVVGTATIGAMPFGVGARPPVLAILEVEHRARLAGHEGDELADVHGRAAAEGDDAVVAAGLVGGEAVVEVLQRRVAVDLGEDRGLDVRLAEDVERLGDDRQVDEAGIGDEQRPARCPPPSAPRGSSAMRPGPKRTAVG